MRNYTSETTFEKENHNIEIGACSQDRAKNYENIVHEMIHDASRCDSFDVMMDTIQHKKPVHVKIRMDELPSYGIRYDSGQLDYDNYDDVIANDFKSHIEGLGFDLLDSNSPVNAVSIEFAQAK